MVSGLRPHTRGLLRSEAIALFRLAFATARCHPLNLAYDRNSPVHSAKGTPSPMNIPKEVQSGLRLLVSVRLQVVGALIELPSGCSWVTAYLLQNGPASYDRMQG